MEKMISIKEVLQSAEFQRDAPEKLRSLLPQSSLKPAMSSKDENDRRAGRSNRPNKRGKKKNAA